MYGLAACHCERPPRVAKGRLWERGRCAQRLSGVITRRVEGERREMQGRSAPSGGLNFGLVHNLKLKARDGKLSEAAQSGRN